MNVIFLRVISLIKQDGLISAMIRIGKFSARLFRFNYEATVNRRRIRLSKYITKELNSTVKYGPMVGFLMTPDSWWGRHERAGMLLGIYEPQVLDTLTNIADEYSYLVDIGAADGYYGVGLVASKIFKESFCFETNEYGRRVIRENAKINNVEEYVHVFGRAQKDFFKEVPKEKLEDSVVLIDIEGGEYELLEEFTFHALRFSAIVIELHEEAANKVEDSLVELIAKGSKTHSCSIITPAAKNPSLYEELSHLGDHDRWLICSEGRAYDMRWIKFTPLHRASS